MGPERRGPDDLAPEPQRPLIVKKVIVQAGDGHHGGAWKVAYADFVTAMMAFFLLLWLLGATTEEQRKGLADYFTPTLVKLREESAGADGLLGGSSITDADAYPHAAGQTGTQALTIPRDSRGGPVEGGGAQEPAGIRARALQKEIEERLAADAALRELVRQVRVVATPEGVRIDMVDDADFSMFALGTTVLVPRAEELFATIGASIADLPAPIIVRGHTDALPWRPGVATNNWSLSAGRAEATRQSLLRSGIAQGRFARIEGVADRELLIADDPADPRNRRISILLLD
ncbi:flagellar motor protein [Aurantiacibacter luteus]|uniref:Flagellar motor protein n=1 Tax=Aurantiacibacter luteus TaxID=1581420 RepID=A0A0G9MPR9_9SPHN|nr:flagellar motor protein [Aurantiacibacter luteus]